MSPRATLKKRRRGPPKCPAPLDMTLLGVPGSPNPRRTVLLSAARPSIKESVAALGLNYSVSSGGIPDFPAALKVSLPRLPFEVSDTPPPGSPPSVVLDISSSSSHYTTTDTSASLSEVLPLTNPLNPARLRTLSLPHSPARQESADAAARQLPLPSPISPATPPLLTPAPVRPARRWGVSVFPQDKSIRRVSSAPSSPISFEYAPASPTSIVAIKSPVEWRDSRRASDAFSFITPFTQETGIPLVLPILAQTPPIPSINLPTLTTTSSQTPAETCEDLAHVVGAGISRHMSKISFGKNSLGTIKESDSPVEAKEKQPRCQVKADPKFSPRKTIPNHKRRSSGHRRESSFQRPNINGRLMLKRDSGAPFAMATAAATELTSSSVQVELAEMKEGRRNTRRWSASRKFLQASTKRAKATVVMMRRGKEMAEEKDIVAVIPQLRELKAPKRLRF